MSKKKQSADSAMIGYSTVPFVGTETPQSVSSAPLIDEERELIRFINSIELTYSGVELLYMKPRIINYLRRLQEKGL
jgi:hypothetical protein